MAEERNALMELAYPQIQTFCQQNGVGFEVVDMRWGVRDYATVDHMTEELCLKEIDYCQKTSMGPTFIVSLEFYHTMVDGLQRNIACQE
ncbi:hypothetical protein GDO86_018126 [Hymenochirus boettgeri]|uniref:DUF4062 domain-containing protein n=1 Tax=Hymenochirus boettgeri TaxID=247094 RepID=A0A8T2IBL7_9PIPI|nr:hypothetical protein GDO86_018126 [Hymenochirus boettgeri]